MEIGSNIRNLRKKMGLRQEQLAEAMRVSPASVSKWETNQSYPEITVLAELADFFEVSMDTLIGHKLNANRMEALIAEMKKAVDDREEEEASALCGKILRNYPNDERAADACANAFYRLFIYTQEKSYMEQCVEQTKRLMSLKRGEMEKERLERLFALGNQHELLEKWDAAKAYYEQSNVNGVSDAFIAGCLLNQGDTQKAVAALSDVLAESVFRQYQAVNGLADGWRELGEEEKACGALEWIYGVMESLHYNATTMMVTQIKLAGLYQECGQKEKTEAALRKAAALAKKNDNQEIISAAGFLQIEKKRELLVSTPGKKELLMGFAASMGSPFAEIINEELE